MNGRGRPLRFVGLVAAGWASARVLLLWPDGASLPQAIEAALPIRRALATDMTAAAAVAPEAVPTLRRVAHAPFSQAVAVPVMLVPPAARDRAELAKPAPASLAREEVLGAPVGALPDRAPVAAQPLSVQSLSRWSASAWFVTRRGAPAGGAMLGGDQAGLRVAYAIDARRRVQLYGRATAPLATAGREVAIGVEWQPSDLPLRVVAEQRLGLDGVPGGPALAVVGGVDAVALPFEFALDAYGQAGAIWRGRVDPFADGALRVTREVARVGKARLAIGGGAWGAAQRDAARLDIGPSAVATLPLGEHAVKLSVDWRQRVAGDARPGSGPAVTLGADF